MFDSLQQRFNAEPMEYTIVPSKAGNEVVVSAEVVDSYVEDALKDTVTQINDAADEILKLAEISEQPRAYEVYGTLLKTKIDALKELNNIRRGAEKQVAGVINNTQINAAGTNINEILKAMRTHQ
jgi:hypothetical protein